MAQPSPGLTDVQVEQMLGNLLRFGVVLSALVVLGGGSLYLARHATEKKPNLEKFDSEPGDWRSVAGIVTSARSGSGRGIIQLGLLLLIATPVARVVMSLFAFAVERDWSYVLFTALVLAVLLFSLMGEQ